MSPEKQTRARCTPEQVDEAAVWMTLLHSSGRDLHTERGFRRWLAANPSHAAAFEKISTAHEVTGGLPRGPFPRLSRWQRAGFREGFTRAAVAMAASMALAIMGAYFYWHSTGVATHVGEQRLLALEDGTQVHLNTDTRIVVDYDKQARRVELKSGEAYFDVAKEGPDRPFVVRAGGREIAALGTAFLVRQDERRLSVTLMEGKVSVGTRILQPGERVTFVHDRAPELDRPVLDKVIAWRSGHVDFDRVPLGEAVAEMNRYSATPLVLERPEAARIPITGIFRAGATRSFAVAVTEAYRLQMVEHRGALVLAGVPASAPGHAISDSR